ncbi:MAG: hypothetical protein ACPLXP_01615 [Microgenomates group bacterium]
MSERLTPNFWRVFRRVGRVVSDERGGEFSPREVIIWITCGMIVSCPSCLNLKEPGPPSPVYSVYRLTPLAPPEFPTPTPESITFFYLSGIGGDFGDSFRLQEEGILREVLKQRGYNSGFFKLLSFLPLPVASEVDGASFRSGIAVFNRDNELIGVMEVLMKRDGIQGWQFWETGGFPQKKLEIAVSPSGQLCLITTDREEGLFWVVGEEGLSLKGGAVRYYWERGEWQESLWFFPFPVYFLEFPEASFSESKKDIIRKSLRQAVLAINDFLGPERADSFWKILREELNFSLRIDPRYPFHGGWGFIDVLPVQVPLTPDDDVFVRTLTEEAFHAVSVWPTAAMTEGVANWVCCTKFPSYCFVGMSGEEYNRRNSPELMVEEFFYGVPDAYNLATYAVGEIEKKYPGFWAEMMWWFTDKGHLRRLTMAEFLRGIREVYGEEKGKEIIEELKGHYILWVHPYW